MPSDRFPHRPFSPKKSAPINWRRGMFRIWILVSMAWIMGWIIYMMIGGVKGEFRMTADILVVPVVLLGPPIALLVFGAAAKWAFRGFNADDRSPNARDAA